MSFFSSYMTTWSFTSIFLNFSFVEVITHYLVQFQPYTFKIWFGLGILISMYCLFAIIVSYMEVKSSRTYSWRSFLWNSENVYLSILLLGLIILRVPGLTRPELNMDEGGLIGGALTLWLDPRYWASVDGTTLGPLTSFPLLIAKVFTGALNYANVRFIGLIMWFLAFLAFYSALKIRFSTWLSRLVSVPVFLSICGFTFWDYVSYNGEHAPILLVSIAFYYFVSVVYLPNDKRITLKLFLLGLFLGLVPYSKLQGVPMALALAFVSCLFALYTFKKKSVFLLVGGLTPTILVFAYLMFSGTFGDFWESYIMSNIIYAENGFLDYVEDKSWPGKISRLPGYLWSVMDTRYFFTFNLLISSIAGILLFTYRKQTTNRDLFMVFAIVITLGGTLFGVLKPGNAWTHYLLFLVFPIACLSGFMIALIIDSGRNIVPTNFINYTTIGAYFLIIGFLPFILQLKNGNPGINEAENNLALHSTHSPEAALILSYAQPGDRMAVLGEANGLYVETNLAQGTREAHSQYQLLPGEQQPYYHARYIADLEKNNPEIFVKAILHEEFIKLYEQLSFKALDDHLMENYTKLSTTSGGYEIYVNNEIVHQSQAKAKMP